MTSLSSGAAATSVLQGSWHCVGFRVLLPGAALREVVGLLPAGWVPADPGPGATTWSLGRQAGGWQASRHNTWQENYPAAEAALTRLLGDLELHVAEHAAGLIAVHAGVVAWEGRALLLPGRSMAGKSTLVHHLVSAGAQYCSDEYALLTPDGLVLPYPRPLSLRPPDGGAGSRIPVERLGMTPTEPVSPAVIASLAYRAGADWEVQQVTPAQGAMAMLDNTVAARSRPVEAMDHVCAAARGTTVLQGIRGEASEAADRLLGLLHDCVPATHDWA